MRSIITVLTLSLVTAGAAHAQMAPCKGISVMTPPEVADGGSLPLVPMAANPASCAVGIKMEPDAGVTLWRCHVDYEPDAEPEDPWLDAVLIMRDGQPVQSYRDDAMMGSLEKMRVVKADLDGDGAPERVLALWNATGNGMGVSTWTLRVFTNDWRPIASFEDVKDWDRTAIVAASKGRKGCDLAITSWESGTDKKGRGGTYFKASFQRFVDGAMAPATDRPALWRRYTFAFEKQRAETRSEDGGDAAAWLSHPSVTRAP